METRNPVFVVGYPRSGTTLLRALLGAHPCVSMFHEPELAFGLYRAGYSIDSVFREEEREMLLSQLREFKLTRRHLEALSPVTLEAFLSKSGAMSFREVYESLLPKPEGARVWGEKSLNNSFLLPILSKLYPRALFVILVRDGRSTILSNYRKAQALYKTKVSGGRSLSDLTPKREDLRFFIREAMKWKEWMQSLERNKQLVAPESVLEIKYEELLQRPEEVLSNICEKVGVQLDERMLSPDSRSDDFVLKRDNAIIHQKVAAPLDPSRATAYESMPPWTIKIVEHYTKSVLQAHGYELSRVELPLKDRVVYKVMSAVYQGRLRNNVKSFFGSRNFSAP